MKHFSNWIKEYNRFSKSDRHSIIILSILILLTLTTTLLIPVILPNSEYDYSKYQEKIEQFESLNKYEFQGKALFQFDPNTISADDLDSLGLPANVKRNIVSYRNAGGVFKTTQDLRKIYGMNDSIFAMISEYTIFNKPNTDEPENVNLRATNSKEGFFDPNIAGINDLIEFGFNQFQAKNVIEYRNNGGMFKTPADIMKIYGVDSVFYNSVINKIRIENTPGILRSVNAEVLYIELNEADSADLVELNGIGPSFASRISKYRDRLGGFYTPSQILEVYNFPVETYSKIEGKVYTDTLKIKKLRINFSDFEDLIRHPYFNKQKVNLILKYRETNGPFRNMDDIRASGIFNEAEFKKVKPYLTCS